MGGQPFMRRSTVARLRKRAGERARKRAQLDAARAAVAADPESDALYQGDLQLYVDADLEPLPTPRREAFEAGELPLPPGYTTAVW